MTTPAISIIFFIVAAFLGALGQYLFKSGADLAGAGLASYLLNWRLTLTLLYPIYASTFIWAALLAFVFQAIPIRPANVAGMGLLVIGMFLMGK
jgi:drug/metabolite transporter (DMT)-like permease